MQISAMNPIALDEDSVDSEVIEKEIEIAKDQLRAEGKPEEMLDKISQGKLNKFISDNRLLNQIWIMDPKKKVKDILKTDITVIDFVRFKVGEGVD